MSMEQRWSERWQESIPLGLTTKLENEIEQLLCKLCEHSDDNGECYLQCCIYEEGE